MTDNSHLIHRYASSAGRFSLVLTLLISTAAAADVKITLEKRGNGGAHAFLALDSSGYPVVSYYDIDSTDLNLLHCVNITCKGKNTIPTVDSAPAGNVGLHTSLVLHNGLPVIAYQDQSQPTRTLKIMRCTDPNCDPAVLGPESVNYPDATKRGGLFTSLVLDEDGYPVVSYVDETDSGWRLRILHCNDLNCAGGDDIISNPDPSTTVAGLRTSLALDQAGNPVVSYRIAGGGLRILHCDDANCAGGGESIATPDAAAGSYVSLALDGLGFPVVAYDDATAGSMKVLHCDDANCAVGGIDSITTPDSASGAANYPSLRLDGAGYPVISYYAFTSNSLKLTHCNDINCAGGDESVTSPDTRITATYTSLRLNAFGNPVVAYYDPTHGNLMILTCDDPNCQ